MVAKDNAQTPSLVELRQEIDRIDEAMHRLLMERGEIIGRLIAAKRTDDSGSAFRPAREAEMMRRLVERHRGILPLDTVESIWRVIISTFTFVQAPYAVHADLTAGDASMRDSARFHFGFTAPFVPHLAAASVVSAVAQSKGDLGLVPAIPAASAGAWWTALEAADAPKIIARLPFVERADHPAALPVFVVARPLLDAMVKEVEMFSLRLSGWNPSVARALDPGLDALVAHESGFDGAAVLLSIPATMDVKSICEGLVKAGASLRSCTLVGSHATRYTVTHAQSKVI